MLRGQSQKAASTSLRPGRFLRHSEVVLRDPTGVLEQLWQLGCEPKSSDSTAPAGKVKAKEALGATSLPRVLEAHYPAKVWAPS